MQNITCFIACAFGHKDVDCFYSNSITKVLNEMNIIPLRVDQLNHNENIDLKIIDLIDKCDFCIADLTYARPSVYYEAGYVHGLKKEVIFTVQKDHLEHPQGNNKVHFDLITKNIISWTDIPHCSNNKLKERIQLIVRPIRKKLLLANQQKASYQNFKSLSPHEQLTQMLARSKNILQERAHSTFSLKESPLSDLYCIKNNSPNEFYYIAFRQSATQKEIKSLILQAQHTLFEKKSDDVLTQSKYSLMIFLGIVMPCSEYLIRKALPHFNQGFNNKTYYTTQEYSLIFSCIQSIKIVIVDNIKSFHTIEETVKASIINN